MQIYKNVIKNRISLAKQEKNQFLFVFCFFNCFFTISLNFQGDARLLKPSIIILNSFLKKFTINDKPFSLF